MNSKIFPIPPVPQQIIDAINNDKFAIFFGAGASIMIGCSSWNQMAKKLVEKCYRSQKKNSPERTCITYKEKEALLQMKEPKKIITICQHILEINGLKEDFFKQIEESLEPDQELLKKQNIYDELHGLRGLFITTNLDRHFDQKYRSEFILSSEEDFNPDDIDESKLYHIHGSIDDWSSVILTVKNYLERYNDRNFKGFLKKIFSDRTILFVGYGFNEFEVLDFLFNKSENSPIDIPKHFILLPFFKGEDNILEFEEHYFRQLGIEVIPYMKDEKGYAQLFDVIKSWKKIITYHSRYLYDTYEELKKAANNYDPEIEKKVLQLISNDKNFEFEFFKHLSKSGNPFPWLKPLINNEYFDPRKNPMPNQSSGLYWNVLAVLDNIATLNNKNPSKEINEEINRIVCSIIDYRDENGERIENPFTDRLIIRIIFLLSEEQICNKYIDFINVCLHSNYDSIYISSEIDETVIPFCIRTKNKDYLLQVLDIILDCKKDENSLIKEYSSILDEYYLEKILEKYSGDIFTLCGLFAIDIAISKVNSIVDKDPSQFNEVWIPSINGDNEFKDRYDYQMIHFIWTGYKVLASSQIKEQISELLQKDHPIFKRIAICAINEYYSEFKEIFWNYEKNPLDDMYLKPELYELLYQHSREFSDTQIETVLNWIENKEYHEEGISDDPKVKEKFLANRKKEWLSALLASNNPEVDALFDKYNSINSEELHHPGKNIVIESFSKSKSPITTGELLEKSNAEVVEYLNTFYSKEDKFGFIAHAICDTFKLSIIECPQKYTEDLTPFLQFDRPYQYKLFLGLSEAWRKGKLFKWGEIFRFINLIIKSEEFWTEEYNEDGSNYRDLIIFQIADLIEEGTKNDSHSFELELLPKAEEVLLFLIRNSESDLFDYGDLVTSVLNSSKGMLYSATICYSLCFARNCCKFQDVRWPESIKIEFEKRLDPTFESSVEFSLTLGKYLSNLYYLDEGWIIKNINRIFPKENETHWNAAFTGYLFYSKIYVDIYKLLKENGHYSKAILTEFKDSQINEILVHHICIFYLEGIEKIDDETSLIYQLLDSWNFKQILELIRFFGWSGKKETSEKKEMILSLWDIIYEKIAIDLNNPNNITLLSELNGWLGLVDDLSDDLCDRLKISVKYMKSHDFRILEDLLHHSEKRPKCTGEIFLEIIEAGNYFDYKEDDIIKFVTILYNTGEKTIADSICNHYLHRGFEFLIPTYRSFQK